MATSTTQPFMAGYPMTLPRPRWSATSVASTTMMPPTTGEAIGLELCLASPPLGPIAIAPTLPDETSIKSFDFKLISV